MLPPISENNKPFSVASRLIPTDYIQIYNCRREHNRLGFAYQLIFVRLLNRFPSQRPFEIIEEQICNLDGLLNTGEDTYSTLQFLKQPPGTPSATTMLNLIR